MLVYLENAYKSHCLSESPKGNDQLVVSVMEGALERVRPIMMTTATTVIGLLPIMWSSGSGSQVMKRIAAPMVGGLMTSTILVLIVIPVVFTIWKGWEIRGKSIV